MVYFCSAPLVWFYSALDIERDHPIKSDVTSLVDYSARTLPEAFLDDVVADRSANHGPEILCRA